MKHSNLFLKNLAIVLTATGLMVCALVLYIWFHLDTQQVQAIELLCQENLFPLLAIGFIFICAISFGLESIYVNYIKPLKKITSETSLIYSSNPSHRINVFGSKDILSLTHAINQGADIYETNTTDITQQIISARKETERERNLLAAIMAELPYAVIICNKNGRILLFNSQAKKMFTSPSSPTRVEHFIGLGRSIFHFFHKERISHALNEIEERLNSHKNSVASYFITPMYNDLLLSVETMPVLGHDNLMTGFILNIQDITNQVKKYDTIDNQLLSFQQSMVTGFGQTKVLLDDLLDISEAETKTSRLFEKKILNTLDTLTSQFEKTSVSILDHNLKKLPLTRIPLSLFLFGIQKRAARENNVRINIKNDSKNRRILADSYSLTAAFVYIVTKLSQITGVKEYEMVVHTFKGKITFDIKWNDVLASVIQVENILGQKIKTLPSIGYVLKQNRTTLKILSKNRQTCTQLRFFAQAELKSIPIKKKRGAVVAGSRPEFYDFDLFKMEETKKDLLNRNLKDIIFSVFDTETTGLDPDGGDEILSIAAVRIVNNQILNQDIFEELVDPKRDIPLESYKFHGINYDMVEGKPDIQTILPLFKIYSYDTVLVAHNSAFDMKMLKVKEKETKTTFSNPVLDTLLLSAILHPEGKHHDLESIAKRLGVSIIGRHTALGDAIATAEIFLKMIPILNSNGIFTLKNALEASQKTYYARLKY